MDEALVEHAQDDVNRGQRGGDQHRLLGERLLVGLRGAGEGAAHGGRHADLDLVRVDDIDRVAQRTPRREVERDGHRRELALVADRGGRRAWAVLGHGGDRHHAAAGRVDIEIGQPHRALAVPRRGLHHDVILVERAVHGGDLPLAEGIVERAVDERGRDAEPCGGVAIILQRVLQPVVLLVGVDVGEDRLLAQLVQELRRPGGHVVEVVALQRVLIERGGRAAAGLEILRGGKIEVHPRHLRGQGPQPRDHVVDRRAQLEVLEGDEQMGGARAGETGDRLHGRIGLHDLDQPLEPVVHRLEGGGLVGLDGAGEPAGILLREEALGDAPEEKDVQPQRDEQDPQGESRMIEHAGERPVVETEHALEDALAGAVGAAVLVLAALEQQRAHHRRGGQRHDHGDEDGDGKRHREFAEEPPHQGRP